MNYQMKPLIFILLTDTFFKLRILIQTEREEAFKVIKH